VTPLHIKGLTFTLAEEFCDQLTGCVTDQSF